jgi:hypothetical protein
MAVCLLDRILVVCRSAGLRGRCTLGPEFGSRGHLKHHQYCRAVSPRRCSPNSRPLTLYSAASNVAYKITNESSRFARSEMRLMTRSVIVDVTANQTDQNHTTKAMESQSGTHSSCCYPDTAPRSLPKSTRYSPRSAFPRKRSALNSPATRTKLTCSIIPAVYAQALSVLLISRFSIRWRG